MIDDLFQEFGRPFFAGIGEEAFRVVDLDDLKILVEDYLQSKIADADLNGAFNSSDFVCVFRAGKYEDTVDDNLD